MNTKLIVAAVACGFASVAAHAAGGQRTPTLAAVQAQVGPRLVVACRDGRLPGYAALSTLLDTNNAGELYAGRVAMHRIVRHACMHARHGLRRLRGHDSRARADVTARGRRHTVMAAARRPEAPSCPRQSTAVREPDRRRIAIRRAPFALSAGA